MSTLRVLHVAQSLDPAGGGLPAVVGQLSEAQRSEGAEVRVVCVEGAPEGKEGVRQLPKPTMAEALLGRGTLTRIVRQEIQEADVVHLHGVWDLPLLIAARIARRAGKPYVVTPHGMLDPWSMGQKPTKKKLGLMLGFRRMLDRATAIHWLNDDEERLAKPLGFRAAPIIVPNGMPRSQLARRAQPGAFRSGRGIEEPYILFLSRLHPKKGLDILADAFATVAKQNPAQLVVAGPDGGAETTFRARIAELGLSTRVTMAGPLYGDAKWAALDDAACFCLPSRQEGFSMAILEAMACRVPVVVTEECHFPEVATAGAGVVVRLDPSAVAEGLLKVLADRDAAIVMGNAGRNLVEAHFTWDKVAQSMMEHYRRWILK